MQRENGMQGDIEIKRDNEKDKDTTRRRERE